MKRHQTPATIDIPITNLLVLLPLIIAVGLVGIAQVRAQGSESSSALRISTGEVHTEVTSSLDRAVVRVSGVIIDVESPSSTVDSVVLHVEALESVIQDYRHARTYTATVAEVVQDDGRRWSVLLELHGGLPSTGYEVRGTIRFILRAVAYINGNAALESELALTIDFHS